MGHEVEAQAALQGVTGVTRGMVRALLEGDALILRGEIRKRLARDKLQDWRAEGDDLIVITPEGQLTLTMGAAMAARWVAVLDRPVPTLAQKLGLAGARVWQMTATADAALEAALHGCAAGDGAQSTLGIAVIRTAEDLQAVLGACARYPGLAVWAIHGKGKQAGMAESTIRAALRGAGLVDTKACAVSATLSGTRYQRRTG